MTRGGGGRGQISYFRTVPISFLVKAFLDWSDLIDVIKFLGTVVLIFLAWVYQREIINFILDITKSAIIILLLGGWLYSKTMPTQTEGQEERNYISRTEEEISLVLDLHNLGVPPIEIGRRLNMARQTVHNIIQRNEKEGIFFNIELVMNYTV